MNSKKKGKLFIVLMISLIAFGFGSCINVLNSGNDVTSGFLPSISASSNEQQISTIGDPSFEPAHVMKQFYNTTNSTNSTPVNNGTNNSTNPSKRNSTQ